VVGINSYDTFTSTLNESVAARPVATINIALRKCYTTASLSPNIKVLVLEPLDLATKLSYINTESTKSVGNQT